MSEIAAKVRAHLISLRDEKYAAFSASLIPNIPPETVIGVRTPHLRAYASELYKSDDAESFLRELPHTFHEENCLHAFLIAKMRDIDTVLLEIDSFLPYVTNWAVCDGLRPGILKKHKPQLLERIHIWLLSEHPYTVRFAIEMLMLHFLGEDFDDSFPTLVAKVSSDEYYVNMMRAWYFAEGLAKQYDRILPYIKEQRLDSWTHRKAIQKAVESFRISEGRKEFLRGLK